MTAQIPDIILLNGVTYELLTNPLETYWEISGRKKPNFKGSELCKRGYVATWAIHGDALLLAGIEGEFMKSNFLLGKKWAKTKISTLFPKSKNNDIKATWYSGKLRVPIGKMTQYAPQGYDSRFEREKFISVNKGNVTKVVILDYTRQQLIQQQTIG